MRLHFLPTSLFCLPVVYAIHLSTSFPLIGGRDSKGVRTRLWERCGFGKKKKRPTFLWFVLVQGRIVMLPAIHLGHDVLTFYASFFTRGGRDASRKVFRPRCLDQCCNNHFLTSRAKRLASSITVVSRTKKNTKKWGFEQEELRKVHTTRAERGGFGKSTL